MQTKTIGIPSQDTEGLYLFMAPEEAVKMIVKKVRYSLIFEQWNCSLMYTARGIYNKMLPPDRAPFLAAFRKEFGDDVDALTDPVKMARIATDSYEAVQEARDCMYGVEVE